MVTCSPMRWSAGWPVWRSRPRGWWQGRSWWGRRASPGADTHGRPPPPQPHLHTHGSGARHLQGENTCNDYGRTKLALVCMRKPTRAERIRRVEVQRELVRNLQKDTPNRLKTRTMCQYKLKWTVNNPNVTQVLTCHSGGTWAPNPKAGNILSLRSKHTHIHKVKCRVETTLF